MFEDDGIAFEISKYIESNGDTVWNASINTIELNDKQHNIIFNWANNGKICTS